MNALSGLEFTVHLATLLRREHACLADFLVALAELDRRGGYRALRHATLFDCPHRELGLSRGAAHYRKVAARLVAHLPEVLEPLRDGRLCLSSVLELAKVLTESNRHEVTPRFFHRSREEAKAVAVEIAPAETVPRWTVVRALPAAPTGTAPTPAAPSGQPGPAPVNPGTWPVHPGELALVARATPRTTVVPLTATRSRLHLTVSRDLLAKLRRARTGQAHVQPGATDEQVIDAAVDLLLAAQEKRRASVPPRVKREVRARDGGRCQWKLANGEVCGSDIRTLIDHVAPRRKGGPSTVEICRVPCRAHNLEAARQEYGEEVMERYVGRGFDPVAREPCAFYLAEGATTPLTTGTSQAAYVPVMRMVAIWSSHRANASSRDSPAYFATTSTYPSRQASQMRAKVSRGTRSVSTTT